MGLRTQWSAKDVILKDLQAVCFVTLARSFAKDLLRMTQKGQSFKLIRAERQRRVAETFRLLPDKHSTVEL